MQETTGKGCPAAVSKLFRGMKSEKTAKNNRAAMSVCKCSCVCFFLQVQEFCSTIPLGGWAVASVVHLDAVGVSGSEANLLACVPEILASDPVESRNRWLGRRCERIGVFARAEGLNRSDP